MRTSLQTLAVMAALSLSALALAQRPPSLGLGGTATPRRVPVRRIETPYYTLHTDLTDGEILEIDLRLTRMFEEYQRVTAGFSNPVKERMPVYVFRNKADYEAAGGPPKSGGVFMRDPLAKKLMTYVGGETNDGTWETLQHEGFHQFIDASLRAPLPIWVNEGLAEYFGQGLWTGDGFVTGLIPPDRLNRVRRGISGPFMPFKKLMELTDEAWIAQLDASHYDEAWAMVHFLAHADNGRFIPPFNQFMNQVAKGTDGSRAWENVFGRDVEGFQRQFAQWWMSMPDDPTIKGYTLAMVQTQTSYLARATLQRQQYSDASAFFKQFKPENMAPTRDLWLPPSMWYAYKRQIEDGAGWTLESGANTRLTYTTIDGTKYTGIFALGNGKVQRVGVQVTPPMQGIQR